MMPKKSDDDEKPAGEKVKSSDEAKTNGETKEEPVDAEMKGN